jgi:hypothetical protein
MREVATAVARYALVTPIALLGRERQRRAERWLRGREELARLRRADAALVSFGKSGRTWLRLMLSRFYHQAYGMPAQEMLGFDNFKHRDARIPALFFTHGNYLRDYTGDFTSRAPFYDKRIVLLVRDPRDIVVSQYFQWRYRMHPRKKWLNRYPEHGRDISMFDFVRDLEVGLPAIAAWLALWEREIGRVQDALVVRYEDMRADPSPTLARILTFLGTPATPDQVADAVSYASLDNMRRLEEAKVFKLAGARLVPGQRDNPQSYKTRRAKVGGFADYFTADERAELERLLATVPPPLFGYAATPARAAAAAG